VVSDVDFERNLAAGTKAEDTVYAWLKMTYGYVQDMRYQTRDKGTGPRLEGQAGSVILPDFAVYDEFRGKKLLDVKLKNKVCRIDGKDYFAIDLYKFRDYLHCADLMRMDGLLLLFVYNQKFLIYDAADFKGIHVFNNNFGNESVLFEYDKSKIRR
jgi:hypothetical protein